MPLTTIKEKPILFTPAMAAAVYAGRKTQTRRVVNWNTVSSKHQARGCFGESGYNVLTKKAFEVKPWENGAHIAAHLRCPYGVPGDRLYVRESWSLSTGTQDTHNGVVTYGDGSAKTIFWQDGHRIHDRYGFIEQRTPTALKKRPGIHMPRWAVRSVLEVVSVRVERVESITEEDALAEGVRGDCECWSCCDGEHAGRCRECAGWGETEGIGCQHCNTEGTCPKCNGKQEARLLFLDLFYRINKRAPEGTNPWVWVVDFRRI